MDFQRKKGRALYACLVTGGFTLSLVIASSFGYAENVPSVADHGWVKAKILNVRQDASLESEVIGKFRQGEIIDILGTDSYWLKVQLRDQTGWVYSPLVSILYSAWVIPQTTEVYQNLTRESAVVINVRQDDQVTVLTEKNDWVYIRKDKKEGWIYKGYLRKNAQDKGWVDATVLNVREKPALGAPVITQLVRGEEVVIQEQQPEWTMVDVPGGRGGWVATPYLSDTQIQGTPKDRDIYFENYKLWGSRDEYLQTNVHIPSRFKAAIQRGGFCIGMNKQQVLVSKGKPSQVLKNQLEESDSAAANEWWIYNNTVGGVYVCFQHDYVIAWGRGTPTVHNAITVAEK